MTLADVLQQFTRADGCEDFVVVGIVVVLVVGIGTDEHATNLATEEVALVLRRAASYWHHHEVVAQRVHEVYHDAAHLALAHRRVDGHRYVVGHSEWRQDVQLQRARACLPAVRRVLCLDVAEEDAIAHHSVLHGCGGIEVFQVAKSFFYHLYASRLSSHSLCQVFAVVLIPYHGIVARRQRCHATRPSVLLNVDDASGSLEVFEGDAPPVSVCHSRVYLSAVTISPSPLRRM